MDNNEKSLTLEETIKNQINNHPDHILLKLMRKDGNYYNSCFNNLITELDESGLFCSKKDKDSLLNKLLIGTRNSFDSNQYLQGVSEIVFWKLGLSRKLQFETDYKCNSDVNNKDVDVRLHCADCWINIEVKCPNQDKNDSDHVTGMFANRVPGVGKMESDSLMNEVEALITETINQNPDVGFTGTERKKINDNKIIDYLKSAQEKFPDSDNEMNILVISLPSNQMQDYYRFLCQPDSGILYGGLRMFNHNASEFDKIDLIMLTNIVSGHDKDVAMNPWDLGNYCNLIIVNPYSRRINDKSVFIPSLLELIPNDNIRFREEKDKILQSGQRFDVGLEYWFINQYLVNYYSSLYNPQRKTDSWF